ncbi:MAG: RNA polymerase sigma factor [Planctomycetota bacterium]
MEPSDSTFDAAFDAGLDPNRLAAHTEWLRGLARRLIRDADAAEDIVQDTLVAALERPPQGAGTDGGLRAWLGAVAQNLARMRRRSDGRRFARESDYAAGRERSAPPSSDVVARATEGRRLIDAVLALDEPYRRAVLLAYQERLPAKEIAARTGVTPDAARKRVSRGLAQLRSRLGASDDGTGRSWLAGLAVLAQEPQIAAPLGAAAWAGGSIMSMKLIGTAAACGALLVLGLVLATSEPSGGPQRDVARIESVTEDLQLVEADAASSAPATREEIVGAEGSADRTGAAVASAARRVRGRFVLGDGRTPVAGATLRAPEGNRARSISEPSGTVLGETDEQGRFELTLEPGDTAFHLGGGLWAEHPDVYDVHVDPDEIPVSAANELEIRTVALGTVLVKARTVEGAPLPGVGIQYMLDATIGSDAQLWGYRRTLSAGKTDASGQLRVTGLPVAMPIAFGLTGEWRRGGRITIDPVRREAEVVVTETPWCSLRAQLRWPDGSPAVGALARWHGTTGPSGTSGGTGARADAEGVLIIDRLAEGGGMLLCEPDAFHAPVHTRVEPGVEADLGVLTVDRPAQVTGRIVVTPESAPLPEGLVVAAFRDGALVARAAIEPSARTFELTVPRGPIVVAATLRGDWEPILPYTGSALGQVEVEAPAANVELPLASRAVTVIGRVEGGSGEVDVVAFGPDAFVDWGNPYTLDGARTSARLEPDGSFRFELPPAASARVLLELEDGRSAYSPEVSLVAGSTVDLGTLGLAPGRLAARIVGADGARVENGVLRAMSHDRGESAARVAGADGEALLELPAGPYGVRVDADADAAGAWRLVHLSSGERVDLDLSHSGHGLLGGIVLGPDGPAQGVSLKTQRESPMTNLSWSATTGPDGRFEFQPLMPGVYRYWISGRLVGRVTLEPNEPADLTLRIDGGTHFVQLLRDGEALPFAQSLSVRARGTDAPVWQRAERLDGGRFRVALPEGELLFQIDLGGLGNNQIALVPGPAAKGRDYALDLPDTGLEVRLSGAAAHRPNPSAYFLDLHGEPLVSTWGPKSEVYAEEVPGESGGRERVLRFPFLAPGARVEMRGVGQDGSRITREVRVNAGGWTPVRWP